MKRHLDCKNLDARLKARAEQADVERSRLDRHRCIANDFHTKPGAAPAVINRAKAEVLRWRSDRLCSLDFIDRWTSILSMSTGDIAETIVSETDGWNALRQNSPFVGPCR